MLEKISDPSYTTPDLSAEMLDLMQNTDFEDRLPLPEGTGVFHTGVSHRESPTK